MGPVTVALATLALYARTAGFSLVYFDDATYLTDNPHVRGGLEWSSAAWAATTLHFGNWHPLTWLSWLAEISLFGFDPAAFHLGNAVLHAANAGLLCLALQRLTGATLRSTLAAALFALHPLRVEAVAWASERKELLAALFGLLALLAWVRHAARPSAGRLALVALAFAASLASKPSWVTLPALLLLLDLWPLGRSGPRRLVMEKLPLLALSLASSLVTLVAQSRGGTMSGPEGGLNERAANALVAYARYLGKTLWPADLSVFYPLRPGGPRAWQVAAAAALLAAVSAFLWRRRREAPWLLLGWCWFLGTLVPVIGLVQVGAQAMADRYTYLPGMGLALAIAWGAGWLALRPGWRRPVIAAAAVALAASTVATWRRLDDWTGHEVLFRSALTVDPGNARAHGNLAYGLWRDGRRDEALEEARQAVELSGGGVREWVNLGGMLRESGRHLEALRAYREAVGSDPRHAPAWLGLGAAEAELGRIDEAVAALREAVRLEPSDGDARRALGELERLRAGETPR